MKPVEAISSLSFSIFRKSTSLLTDMIESAFGISALTDIAEFLGSFKDFATAFKERSEKILRVLQDPGLTSFTIVSSAQRLAIEEALYIAEKLEKLKLSLGFTVVNRVATAPGPGGLQELADEHKRLEIERQLVELDLDLDSLIQVSQMMNAMAKHDRNNIATFQERLPDKNAPLVWVPFFPKEICDLEGLMLIGRELYGS